MARRADRPDIPRRLTRPEVTDAQSTHGRRCAARPRSDRTRLQALLRRTLRVFVSALTDAFDTEGSDIDFLVDFVAGKTNLFNDYFDLKFELERITGRHVDLVDASAIRNPFFRASALENTRELYSA